MTTAPAPIPTRSPRWLLVPLAGFAVVSLLAGFLADAELDRGRLRVLRGLRRQGPRRPLASVSRLGLPTAGGLLFATLIAVWYTSAVWFFRLVGRRSLSAH